MDDLTASLLPAQARKCLFGRPDSQEMDSYLNSELTKIEKRHKETWNFDFDNEQPLQGDWEWEKVSPETTRQVVTTECSETIGSAGTASSGCIDANALPRIEQCATGPLQSVQVDNKPTEPERDETGRASVRSDVVQTAEKVVTSSPSKCLPTGEESLELRRSPRRNPPSSTITEFFSARKRFSSCSDATTPGSSAKRKPANQTPVRQSQRLSDKKRRRDARPRSLSFDESCSPTSC